MEGADAVGVAGVPGQGRYVVVYVRVERGRIVEASFQCSGCGVTVACGSALTELVRGRSIRECETLTADGIIAALDGVPEDKRDRADFALSALQDALRQVEGGRGVVSGEW